MEPTKRFSKRAENYVRFRPGYPAAVLDSLRDECGLTARSVVADVGSGTGKLTEMFLKNGNTVFAVEPNKEMRREAERLFGAYTGFKSVRGQAEETTLAGDSVDLVTAGQAFHWFDARAARLELGRILRPGGFAALIWNARDHKDDPLMSGYEKLLASYGMGYHHVRHRAHDSDIDVFFADGRELRTFAHSRTMDFDALWGGFLSSSYAPLPGDPHFEPMRAELQELFANHQQNGFVTFLYETSLYFGKL